MPASAWSGHRTCLPYGMSIVSYGWRPGCALANEAWPGGMPVLRGEGMVETAQQAVDHRHDRVAARHRQLAARHECRLNVDQAEDVGHCGSIGIGYPPGQGGSLG